MSGRRRLPLLTLLLPWLGMASAGEEPLPQVWQQARERGVVLRAVGNEPGWLLELDGDGGALMLTDYGNWRRTFTVTATGNDTEFMAVIDGNSLRATFVTKACSDTMSDRIYPLQATVTLGDRTFHGCGIDLD